MRLWPALLLIVAAPDATAQLRYSVADLGALASGAASFALDLNNLSQVVGHSGLRAGGGGPLGAFLWDEEGGIRPIAGLPDGHETRALAINDNGQIAGWTDFQHGVIHGFVNEDGSVTDLGAVDGGLKVRPEDLNDSAQVVGAADQGANGGTRAFLWQLGSIANIDTFGGIQSSATGINNSGQIVGWFDGAGAGDRSAFLREGGVGAPLTRLPRFSEAWAINDAGQIAGRYVYSDGAMHGFVWKDGLVTDLGEIGAGGHPQDINESGDVVGFFDGPNNMRAFVWQDGEFRDLNDLIPTDLIPPELNNRLRTAHGINDHSEILGVAEVDGRVFAYLLKPDEEGDSIPDRGDNCTLASNEKQRDSDSDGYGNACDADLNNDGIVDFLDLGLLKSVFLTSDADADFNGDGTVDFLDLGLMKSQFFQPPGPSGLECAGTVPCP